MKFGKRSHWLYGGVELILKSENWSSKANSLAIPKEVLSLYYQLPKYSLMDFHFSIFSVIWWHSLCDTETDFRATDPEIEGMQESKQSSLDNWKLNLKMNPQTGLSFPNFERDRFEKFSGLKILPR